eukprot:699636-Amorphochlora_amoeboformis.AAC.1
MVGGCGRFKKVGYWVGYFVGCRVGHLVGYLVGYFVGYLVGLSAGSLTGEATRRARTGFQKCALSLEKRPGDIVQAVTFGLPELRTE